MFCYYLLYLRTRSEFLRIRAYNTPAKPGHRGAGGEQQAQNS